MRCSACPGSNTCVRPVGPKNAQVLFIGEAPSKDDNRLGEPFTGKLSTELDYHFLPLAGLKRPEVYLTNACQCLPTTSEGRLQMSKEKDKEMVRVCATNHLYDEILAVSPEVIVPMGTFACMVIDPTIQLDLHHGIPRETKYGTVFPMWHPSGGIHEPKKMLQIRTDFIRLKRYLQGTLTIYKDAYPNPDYQEVTSKAEIKELDTTQIMGADTEFDPDGNTVCLTYSIHPGTGRLIRAGRKDLLHEFQLVLGRWAGPIVFHHWMADRPKVEQIGLKFPDKLIRDSMVRMYQLGNLPKGLKSFGYRELGVIMEDFEDVVRPYSTGRVIDYFRSIQKHKWPIPEPELQRTKEGGWKVYQAQTMNTKVKRFFTDYGKNPDKDILEMWGNWSDQHEAIEAVCGKYYGLDIRDVPFEIMKHYACKDADITGRAWPVLEAMVDNMAGKSQENWRK